MYQKARRSTPSRVTSRPPTMRTSVTTHARYIAGSRASSTQRTSTSSFTSPSASTSSYSTLRAARIAPPKSRSRHQAVAVFAPTHRSHVVARAKKGYDNAKDAEEDLLFWNEEDLDDEDDDGGFVSSFTDDDDEDYDDEDDEWFFVPDGANVRTQSEDLFNIDDEDGHGGYVMDYVKMANTRGGGGDASGTVNTSSRSPKKRVGASAAEAAAKAAPKRVTGETSEIASKNESKMSQDDIERMVAMGVPRELLFQIEEEKKEVDAFNKQKEYEATRKTHKRLTIVAGKFGKRKVLSPSGLDTRPMMAMVRGATFDMMLNFLGSRSNVQFPPNSRWLDLFCGTGAIGIEGISRGVEEAHFVEMDPWVTNNVTNKNLASLGLTKQTTVHTASVQAFLTQHHKSARAVGGAFDFISFCPPYEKVSYPELLLQLDQSALVKDSTILIVEYAKGQADDILPEIGTRLRRVRDRRYGRTFVAIYVCDGRNLDDEYEDGPEVATKFNKAVFKHRN